MTSPTLHDLFVSDRVKAISFWCTNHECQRHDIEHKGMVAIDYGPSLTLSDFEPGCSCVACGAGRMQIRPNWGEGGHNLLERSVHSMADLATGRGMADVAAKIVPEIYVIPPSGLG